MPKRNNPNDYELRDEYDFSKMTALPKGRYAPQRRAGKNIILLAPDVMRAFPTDESVNQALRLVMQMARIPSKRRVKRVKVRPASRKRISARPA
jgi:hypothetical protein